MLMPGLAADEATQTPESCGNRLRSQVLGRQESTTTGEFFMALQSSLDPSARETHSLIGSDKVQGTSVYRSNGEKVGNIDRVMIDKISGKVSYAVMSFGGFMGIGEDYYPLPWKLLTYNPQLEGYEVNIAETQLKGAPRYSTHETWDWSTRGHTIDDYYKVPSSAM
jgi:PRC-barrel domain